MSEQPKVTKSGVFLGLLLCWPLVLVAFVLTIVLGALFVGAFTG
jgi:hypothetical protein